ncbi:hypothetical protein H0Z60_03530 [Ectothiorhodospiraceae bacterium WFHF3C12]|nr:hypothetical protein [Ectothiorhodospiraceae bacterium WFHF3C12]
MTDHQLHPDGEGLSKAVRWLSDNRPVTRPLVEEAARRFDLSPLEAEFLFREYLPKQD